MEEAQFNQGEGDKPPMKVEEAWNILYPVADNVEYWNRFLFNFCQ